MCGDTSIDLDSCFPSVADSTKRALNLALDPVAAADFYDFSIRCMIEHLFGWDFDKGRSSLEGGILGHLAAFYGSHELTERGQWHGHFLLWLQGAPNPSDIHARLKADSDFEKRFFRFFEAIIHHHFPDIDFSPDEKYEPRTQRPPIVPSSRSPADTKKWRELLDSEIKKCGESLQRHDCRRVCHKYGHDKECRFQFPHELVPESKFDPDTNSIYLTCKDPTVNYFNPIILVYCRHNHDLKCILSGKAAKAAMFYITDYITKMDLKTYQMLSLLSKAVLSVPKPGELDSPVASAKKLLHKCLSQLTRRQQIHAQQAAWYIRGRGDGMPSHSTTPMLSGVLLYRVKQMYHFAIKTHQNDPSSKQDEADDLEPVSVKLTVDSGGRIRKNNQVDDYIYRDESLCNIFFYDFVQRFRLEVKGKQSPEPDDKSTVRLGTYKRWRLRFPHPLWESHQIVEHTNFDRGDGSRLLIPRVTGISIPRPDQPMYDVFLLAHFKPFSDLDPLFREGQLPATLVNDFQFSPLSQKIISNWIAINECEDERDAERLKKRDRTIKESIIHINAFTDFGDDLVLPAEGKTKSDKEQWKIAQDLLLLEGANFFRSNQAPAKNLPPDPCHSVPLPTITPAKLSQWKKDISDQEQVLAKLRREGPESINPMVVTSVLETEVEPSLPSHPDIPIDSIPPTETASSTPHLETREELLQRIILEETLNEKQIIAFRIITRSFFQYMDDESLQTNQPGSPAYVPYLKLLLSGPGGTGKTHVVKAVQRVMETYGFKHRIRFLAPSGTAAALIDGMTIHKALAIKIQNSKTHCRDFEDTSRNHYHASLSVAERNRLRAEFKDVIMVLIDEVSLLSPNLLAEVDSALRFAKNNDTYFGGIIMIFSGDFYQYPPVMGTPLYRPVTADVKAMSSLELLKRLGRLAWKSVTECVNLEEQQRMKGDPDYTAAVLRLRKRQCTQEDVDLFNSRVMRSVDNPEGVDMNSDGRHLSTAIVATNSLRHAINLQKAKALCAQTGQDFVLCAARDTVNKITIAEPARSNLLKLDFSKDKNNGDRALPGYLPFYNGMPVILKNRNISTELGLTNGAEGILRKFSTNICSAGLTYFTGAIVEFPSSKAALQGLPPKYVPIEPATWSFSYRIPTDAESGKMSLQKLSRTQSQLHPGFAVTGQGAQGRTLPLVLGWLHYGSYYAYVTASRARSRQGLVIVQKVTLKDLNKPLEQDLVKETQRHEVMEHNTLIRFGFRQGALLEVPDPEGEHIYLHSRNYHLRIEVKTSTETASGSKRKPDSQVKCEPAAKKIKFACDRTTDPQGQDKDEQLLNAWNLIPHGCKWNPIDWSCGYDSMFMSFYCMYLQWDQDKRLDWTNTNVHTTALGRLFEPKTPTTFEFSTQRDHFRNYLNGVNPMAFPLRGPVLISATDISDYMFHTNSIKTRLLYTLSCMTCGFVMSSDVDFHHVGDTITASLWQRYKGAVGCPAIPTTQHWLEIFLLAGQTHADATCRAKMHNLREHHDLAGCQSATDKLTLYDPPCAFQINVEPSQWSNIVPSSEVHVATVDGPKTYKLRAIVYHGAGHFTARLFDNLSSWNYDGQVNNGDPVWNLLTDLNQLEDRKIHILLYARA